MTLAAGVAGFDQPPTCGRRSHPNHLFAITLCVSVAAHAGILLLAPPARDPDRPAPLPLEVALVRPPVAQPPQAVAPPPSAAVRPPAVARPALREAQAVRPVPAPVPEPRPSDPPQVAPPRASSVTLPHAPAVPPAIPPASPVPAEARVGVPAREPSVPVAPSVPSAPPAAVPALVTVPPSFDAAYLRNAPPGYPMAARRSGVEGTVRLKVRVTREGRAAQVQLEQTSGSRALDTAALDAVRTWQFVPARRGEEAIESWVLVPVVFKLEGAI